MDYSFFKKVVTSSIICLMAVLAGYFIIQPINLVNSDIGRHLTNGKIISQQLANFNFSGDIWFTNFYSQNYADLPFINHHWLSGVIFYHVNQLFGFVGLNILMSLLIVFTVVLIFAINRRRSVTTLIALCLTLPLLVSRTEIRPEIFSLFFTTLLLYLLQQSINKKLLLALFVIFLLWANLHIYFIWGLGMLWLWTLIIYVQGYFQKNSFTHNQLLPALVATIAVFFTPFTWRTITFPLLMVKDFGYKLAENQSIFFLENHNITANAINSSKIVLILTIIFSVSILIINWANDKHVSKEAQSLPRTFVYIAGFINLIVGVLIYRHLPFAGIFATLVIAESLTSHTIIIKNSVCNSVIIKTVLILTSGLVCLLGLYNWQSMMKQNHQPGLLFNNLKAVEFINNNQLAGPIFNNYDNGSYLIYGLYPHIKPFVDNRPEAYSKTFFNNIYIKSLENYSLWQQLADKNKFNLVIFGYNDLTPWSQTFLSNIIKDTSWQPIYVDDQTLIFIKNTPQNQTIIKQYEIPRQLFRMK